MVVWFSGFALAAPVNCDSSVQKAEVDQVLGEAEAAVGALDEAALAAAVERARGLVVCVDTELAPADIARLYRLSGISSYVGGDLVTSVADFEVAKALDPNAAVPAELGRPLRMTYDAVPPPSGETRTLAPPSEGWIDVDGRKSQVAPADRGFFLQWVGDQGVRGTWLLAEGDTIPYPMGNVLVVKRKPGKALLATGIVGGVLAGGAIGTAAVLRGSFVDSEEPSSELGGLVTGNRALGYGGIGLGVASLGLIGASLAVGF